MRQKLRGKSGETLTETLTGVLLIGLASLLFVTMLGAALRLLNTAAAADHALYQALSHAEAHAGGTPAALTFSYADGSLRADAFLGEAAADDGSMRLYYYTYHKEAGGT